MLESSAARLRVPASRARILAAILDENRLNGDMVRDIVHPDAVEMPAVGEIEVCRRFVAQTQGRPDLWLEAGFRQSIHCYGLHGLTAVTAPTFSAFLDMIAATHEMSISFCQPTHMVKDGASLGVEMDMRSVPTDLYDFTLLCDLAGFLSVSKQLCAGQLPVTHIALMGGRERYGDALKRLPVNVEFGADANRLYWETDTSTRPLFFGNADLHGYYMRQCQQIVALLSPNDVIARLNEWLRTNRGTLSEAANDLGLYERTLQRRLSEAGLTFRKLATRTSMDQAQRLLREERMPVAEVATRLGYAEIASFSHAFKRWTGVPPGIYAKSRDLAVQ